MRGNEMERCRKKINMLCCKRGEGKVTEELPLRSKRRMKNSRKFKNITEWLNAAASQIKCDEMHSDE